MSTANPPQGAPMHRTTRTAALLVTLVPLALAGCSAAPSDEAAALPGHQAIWVDYMAAAAAAPESQVPRWVAEANALYGFDKPNAPLRFVEFDSTAGTFCVQSKSGFSLRVGPRTDLGERVTIDAEPCLAPDRAADVVGFWDADEPRWTKGADLMGDVGDPFPAAEQHAIRVVKAYREAVEDWSTGHAGRYPTADEFSADIHDEVDAETPVSTMYEPFGNGNFSLCVAIAGSGAWAEYTSTEGLVSSGPDGGCPEPEETSAESPA